MLKHPSPLRPPINGPQTEIVLDGSAPSACRYLGELWSRRELVLMLAKRDFSVRFKSTVGGVLWVMLKPLLLMLALTLVFGRVSGLSAQTAVPYTLVVLSGLVPWFFFSASVQDMTSSLVSNQHIVTKIWFPRAALPLAAIAAAGADFLVSLGLFALMCLFLGFPPLWSWLLVPVFAALLLMLTFGVGLWLALLNARFRDIQQALPFMLLIGMYVSPVGYQYATVPAELQSIYNLNPMVGVIEGFRWALTGEGGLHVSAVAASSVIALGLVVTGFLQFRRVDARLAEIL